MSEKVTLAVHPSENPPGTGTAVPEAVLAANQGPAQSSAAEATIATRDPKRKYPAGSDSARHTPASSVNPVQVVCAIPARFASQRLPGKPLRQIAGKPMIQHVVERARAATGIARTVVLTDDERIARAVRQFGGEVEMTPAECASGTDRIAWAARSWPVATGADGRPVAQAVINVQGDEPLVDPALVSAVAQHLIEHPDEEMVTVAAPLDVAHFENPDHVKVVTDLRGFALYFSRSLIPYRRDSAPSEPIEDGPIGGAKLHVGLYGYRLDVLERLAALEPTPLERSESLEQLRALEHGIRIRVLNTTHAAFGIDTEDDLQQAEALLAGRQSIPGMATP